MTSVSWVASITVNIFDENGDDYTGDDPIRAARLAFDEILSLSTPMVQVQRRITREGFFSEPLDGTISVVDLETGEVVEV